MEFEIMLTAEAVWDLKRLSARERAIVKDAMDAHLRYEPMRVSESRIKRLRGLSRPQYRLRVGDIRVFYDVRARFVEILAIVAKADANRWLEEEGEQP